MSMDGQRTKSRRNIAENYNGLSRVHERYRGQTDRRQTDGRQHIANVDVSSRSFTFAKKGLGLLWAEKKEPSRRLMLLTACRVPSVTFFLHVETVGLPTCSDWNYMSGSRRVDTSNKIISGSA